MSTTEPMEAHVLDKLKSDLRANFVPHLPKLIKPSADDQQNDAKQCSRAFAGYAISKLTECSAQVAAGSVIDDNEDRGIDAIYYHAESEVLYLVQAKMRRDAQVTEDDTQAFVAGIRALLNGDYSTFNLNVSNRQAEIDDALDNCRYIRLVLAFVGSGVAANAALQIHELLRDPPLQEERLGTDWINYDAARATADLMTEFSYKPIAETLQLSKHSVLDSSRAAYVGLARVQDLVRMHKAHGTALYAKNLRHYLGAGRKGSVNASIQETLRDRPADFVFLNNGVTALSDTIDPKSGRGGQKKLKVRGLSIINGAQTVASCAEFAEANPTVDISGAKVLFTLIRADSDNSFGAAVTRARNHQNPVAAQDFSGLDQAQERLRVELAVLGKVYAFRAEAPEIYSDKSRISLIESSTALALHSIDPRYAVVAKRDARSMRDPVSSPVK